MPNTVDTCELSEIAAIPLVDHHVHGADTSDLDEVALAGYLTESSHPSADWAHSPLGMSVRAHCAPLLDLAPFPSPQHYVARRAELGAAEVNRRMLRAMGVQTLVVETGVAQPTHTTGSELAELAGAQLAQVVRLEVLAEALIAEMVHTGAADTDYADRFRQALAQQCASAVGVKSIAAYRAGLDLPPQPPSLVEVARQVALWRAEVNRTGRCRLTDPVLIAFGVYCAVDLHTVIQFHVGFGDVDAHQMRANPLLLTDFLNATVDSGCRIALLHCYPYQRAAGMLCHLYRHVYADVGLALNYAGAAAPTILAELCELAPAGKVLFSSDAYGASELHYLGAWHFRQALGELLRQRRVSQGWPVAECLALAHRVCRDNAVDLYGLGE